MKTSSLIHMLILLILMPALILTGCGSKTTLELSGTIEATQTEIGRLRSERQRERTSGRSG
jgi:predicted small lipoprotein YifL